MSFLNSVAVTGFFPLQSRAIRLRLLRRGFFAITGHCCRLLQVFGWFLLGRRNFYLQVSTCGILPLSEGFRIEASWSLGLRPSAITDPSRRQVFGFFARSVKSWVSPLLTSLPRPYSLLKSNLASLCSDKNSGQIGDLIPKPHLDREGYSCNGTLFRRDTSRTLCRALEKIH